MKRYRQRPDLPLSWRRARLERGHPDQLEPLSAALLVQLLQHELAGPALVGVGGHDERGHRQAGHVDGDDTLGALGAAVGAAAVVEGEPTVRGARVRGGCR
ncbi:MAG TPA: hypothetical protein VJ820_19240 [Propionibacteriaceae bacterium]|nr:hypothetical protein [Propionibacteriaceae bacterium]